ncbi:testis-specific serine/threonine-protein kinase 1-like [Clupea harengus]|uniref:non-specific serine/threonine protein kinase n=1 Tax=Clupea harengus TaxID=7950 RepID=A0A8M1KRY0_CLUHA|nr:testis-specific serine/threonine-protein kinase 1-like [Clupea harengus]
MDDSQVLKKRGYTQGISLGEGSYAKVKSSYSEHLKRNVAVKIINKQKAPKDFLVNFLPRELDIMACLNHRNIVKTYEIFEASNGKVYIVMELGVQGNLLEFIEFRGALPPEFCKKLFRQICHAITFIHDKDIVHRDIKCENLLLDKDFNLKVADFGFSRRLTYSDAGAMELSKTFCGSEGYAAPEVLQGVPYDPKLYDVWSMGIVLYVMVCGSMPFDDSNVKKMIKVQKAHRLTYPRSVVISPLCKELIYRILHPDPKKRMKVVECLEHSWLQEECDATESSKVCQNDNCEKRNIIKAEPEVEPDLAQQYVAN